MSDLLVITFQKETDAADALARIKSVQHSGGLNLSDVAIVTKDAAGKVNVENHADSAEKAGAVGGGALGLLIGMFFFPVLGIVIGAGIGALIGKSLHHNVDPGIVRDVTTDLTPGTSAVFILVDGSAAGSGRRGGAVPRQDLPDQHQPRARGADRGRAQPRQSRQLTGARGRRGGRHTVRCRCLDIGGSGP